MLLGLLAVLDKLSSNIRCQLFKNRDIEYPNFGIYLILQLFKFQKLQYLIQQINFPNKNVHIKTSGAVLLNI